MIHLLPGPVGVTEDEARRYARRLAAPDSQPVPLLDGLLRLYPFAPEMGGPSDHYQLVLDDSRHGTLRLATLTPNEVAG